MSDNEAKYKIINFDEIDYDQNLPCDLFLSLGSKYVKFCNNQDIPNIARIEKLKEQGVKNLFIQEEDDGTWEMYLAVTEQRKTEEKEGRISTYTKKTVEKCRKIAMQKIEKVYSFTNADQALSMSGDLTSNIISDLTNRPNFLDNFLLTYKDDFNLFEHTYNVATISLSLGKILNLDQSKMYNLGAGAILHDVGKRDIVLDSKKAISEYTSEELETYKKHPALGAQFLRKGKALPEDIYVIVFQHHERISGEGFPQGLKKQGFNDLAQIVALANEMDHFLQKTTIATETQARDISKQLIIDFLGHHELKLIKKISGIISEMADEIKQAQ